MTPEDHLHEGCRLCGATEGETVLRPTPYALVRCRRCGLVRTEGAAAGGTPGYDATYYSAHALADTMRGLSSGRPGLRLRLMDTAYDAYLDRSGRRRLQRLLALPVRGRLGGLPPRGFQGTDLLDVGSGDGDFLRRAGAAGYRVVGQEINPQAVASARRAGVDVRLGELDDIGLAAESSDAVRLWHVLEHVADPVAILKTARRLLRPRGLLIVGVPDFGSPARRLFGRGWSGLQLPFHRHHFTQATLRRVLKAGGFSVDSLRHRSVGTIYSSLTDGRGLPGPVSAPVWLALLALDDLLDIAGRGDTLEAIARPA